MSVRIDVAEGNGFDLDPPAEITFPTRALVPPELIVADVGIDDVSGNGQIEPREIVEITTRIQNRGSGGARSVKAALKLGQDVFLTPDSKSEFDLGDLKAGEYRDIIFSIFTNTRAAGVPVSLSLSESRGKYGVDAPLALALNRPQRRASELVIAGKDVPSPEIPSVATLSVDIERNIPRAKAVNTDAVAVVIGNTNYSRFNPDAPDVEFAGRDAALIKEYLITTFGYREGNILYRTDAGLADFRDIFGTPEEPRGRLGNMVKEGNSDVFVYYCGHGAPAVVEEKGYLVPVDCSPSAVTRNGYPLDLLYENLGKLGARSVVAVIDACFSGASENGKMLIAQSSPINIHIADPTPSWGRGALFTASSANEIASWYPDMKHGLFTYFFLKGLQGTADKNGDGTITAQELHTYLADPTEGVPYWARRLHNGRIQTPNFKGEADFVIYRR
jgi:hypothetical protein